MSQRTIINNFVFPFLTLPGFIFAGNTYYGIEKYRQHHRHYGVDQGQIGPQHIPNLSRIVMFSFGKSILYGLSCTLIVPPCIVWYDVYQGC